MTVDRSVLLAYLRQRAEVGERSLLLENLSRSEALATLREKRAPAPARAAPSDTADDARARGGLQVLQTEAASCTRCRLHETRSTVVFGEVGLAGEVRGTSQASLRVREAAHMGFTRCVLPDGNCPQSDVPSGLELVSAKTIGEALDLAIDW